MDSMPRSAGIIEKVSFSFEGRTLEGIAGEPVARALFRAGVRTLSYSMKYHYPRGIRCGRGRCRQCDMEINGCPGVPSCITPLEAGMVIRREDFRPFYAPLVSSLMRKLTLPAGFYYRFFTKPKFINKTFSSNLRKMTGIGRLHTDSPPFIARSSGPGSAVIHSLSNSYDVIVVGGGVAGLSAALAAASFGSGARILLVEETAELGGLALFDPRDREGRAEKDRLRLAVEAKKSITVVCRAVGLGYYPPDTLLVQSSESCPSRPGILKRIRAKAFVFATGAYDSLPLFENNHLPGIFGPRAVRLFLERDGYPLGDTAVIYGTGRPLEDTAAFLESRGVRTAAVVEAGSGTRLTAAGGRWWVQHVTFKSRNSGKTGPKVSCDFLCLAFPGQGTYELPQQAGFQFRFSDDASFEAKRLLPIEPERRIEAGSACFLAGEITGETDRRRLVEQGREAGGKAAAEAAGSS
jgi:sarcosine oxidase subunit alpha